MNFKHLGRYIACLLLCVLTVGILVDPASAVAAAANPVAPEVVSDAPALELGDPVENSKGRCVTRVRRSASVHSMDIGSFVNGTKLTVLESKGDFYKVDCFDMKGYVAKSQVKEENGEYYVNCQEGSSETKYLPAYSVPNALDLRNQILEESQKYIGVRYVSGGTSPRGFDCSGYVMYIYNKVGVDLSRVLGEQMASGVVVAKDELQIGDLVIFSNTTGYGHFASHIGIYIGNNQVIHASSGRGITIDSLDKAYYTRHYQCARRVILTELAPSVSIPTTGTSDWRS